MKRLILTISCLLFAISVYAGPLQQMHNKVIAQKRVAGGETVTNVYVDPDATGTEDGESWTNAYVSLFDAEAAEQSVLSQPMFIHCRSSSGTADTAKVTIDGWTTTTDNYLKIIVDQADRHDGKWSTSAYRLEITGTPFDPFIVNNEPFVHLDGLQIKYTTDRSSTYNALTLSGVAGWTYVSNTIITGENIGTGLIAGVFIADISTSDKKYLWNNIIYTDGVPVTISTQNSGEHYIYSCTTYATAASPCFNRSFNSNGSVNLKNIYGASNGNEVYVSGDTWNTKTTCASDDTTGSVGLQNIAHSVSAGAYFTNITSGSEDYHIGNALSDLIGAATDTSGEAAPLNFTTDIDGATRSSWDVGADEF